MCRGDGREAAVLVAAPAPRRRKPDGIVVALDDLPHQSGCNAILFRECVHVAMVVQRDAATAEAHPNAVLSICEHAAALPAGFFGLAMRDERVPIPRQQAARRRAEPERICRWGGSIPFSPL